MTVPLLQISKVRQHAIGLQQMRQHLYAYSDHKPHGGDPVQTAPGLPFQPRSRGARDSSTDRVQPECSLAILYSRHHAILDHAVHLFGDRELNAIESRRSFISSSIVDQHEYTRLHAACLSARYRRPSFAMTRVSSSLFIMAHRRTHPAARLSPMPRRSAATAAR
jgi:hypothetical protein